LKLSLKEDDNIFSGLISGLSIDYLGLSFSVLHEKATKVVFWTGQAKLVNFVFIFLTP